MLPLYLYHETFGTRLFGFALLSKKNNRKVYKAVQGALCNLSHEMFFFC